jgi:carbon monoxide dehydrogenase subunit G
MARYVTRLHTDRPAGEVFAYLADLRNFADWDPGVRDVVQVEGEGGGPGTEFDVTVAGIGVAPDLTLRYRTVLHDAPNAVHVLAEHPLFVSDDRITVEAADDGSTVTYDADLRLRGPLRLGDLGLRLVFGRIGDRAAAGLRRALDGTEVAA